MRICDRCKSKEYTRLMWIRTSSHYNERERSHDLCSHCRSKFKKLVAEFMGEIEIEKLR